MKNQEMKMKATEIVRQAVREREGAPMLSALDAVPSLLESIVIDKDYILACVEQELSKKTGNPVNALLGLFGLRIVSTQTTMDALGAEFSEDRVVTDDGGGSRLEAFLKIDEKKLKQSVGDMIVALEKVDAEEKQSRQSVSDQYGRLHGEMDRLSTDYTQLRSDYEGQMRSVAERAQHMLSIYGKECADPAAEQLLELLEDLNMRAVWPGEAGAEGDEARFTSLKTADPEKHRTKPCILTEKEVFLKGIRFTA